METDLFSMHADFPPSSIFLNGRVVFFTIAFATARKLNSDCLLLLLLFFWKESGHEFLLIHKFLVSIQFCY